LEQDVIDRLLEQPEIGLILQTSADGRLVQHAVGLRTRGPYRRPFAGIEDVELDTAFVRGRRHGATQRVDLLDQMSLADATDGWITGHLPQRLDIVRQQQRRAPHARTGERSLGAGVTTTHYNDIENIRELHI